MFTKSIQIVTLASVVGLLGSSYATAQMNSASAAISMRATVPLVCRVSFTASGDQDTLGLASQFCNSPDGYTLYASATGDVDGAELIINNSRVPLVEGEEVAILQSNAPARKTSVIGYEPSQDSTGGNLTLRIEAN